MSQCSRQTSTAPLGPMLSVHFRDPDGFESEINAVNPSFSSFESSEAHGVRNAVEEEPDPTLYDRLVAACSRHAPVANHNGEEAASGDAEPGGNR